MNGVVLRAATIEDLPILKKWDEEPHVVESDPNDDWNWEIELSKTPDWREQLIAEVNGKAIGFVQIIDPYLEESHYWGDCPRDLKAIDIWIGEKEYLGKGYGTIIMKMALERCFKNKSVRTVLIDPLESNSDAIRFYEKLGFQFLEKRIFDKDHCMVYQLTREKWLENL